MKADQLKERLSCFGLNCDKVSKHSKVPKYVSCHERENRMLRLLETTILTKPKYYIFTKSFFYTHGYTADGFASAIEKALEKAGLKFEILEAIENWRTWPKDSTWQVVIKLQL